MSYTSITDASFQDVLNLWFSTDPPGTKQEFTDPFYTPFYGQIEIWDTQLVTDMSNAFNGKGTVNYDISRWNTSKVINMEKMFENAFIFNQSIDTNTVKSHPNPVITLPYIAWDVSGVQNMGGMFNNAYAFNQPLNNWNVGNVTKMSNMFNNAFAFNQPLNNWNVGNVTNMNSMFVAATAFNQPLNNWNVGNVTKMDYMFSDAVAFNQPLNNWNVGNVTKMEFMFYAATAFNQPLNNWDVSNVTNMEYMFSGAVAFNQPLNNWDVSNVTNMSNMFNTASSFDQYIRSWDVSSSTILTTMFLNCPLATDSSVWNTQSNPDTGNNPPGQTPTATGYFNQTPVIPYATYTSYDYNQYPIEIIMTTNTGSPVGAGTYTLISVTSSEIPTSIIMDSATGTLTISTKNILGCKNNYQTYTIRIQVIEGQTKKTGDIIVNIKNTPQKLNAFPFPLEQKNKSLHGVNQKLDPGTARPNYFITRSQFNPARFRSKQSNLSNPSLCFF